MTYVIMSVVSFLDPEYLQASLKPNSSRALLIIAAVSMLKEACGKK